MQLKNINLMVHHARRNALMDPVKYSVALVHRSVTDPDLSGLRRLKREPIGFYLGYLSQKDA